MIQKLRSTTNIALCQFLAFSKSSKRSDSVLLSFLTFSFEFLTNKLEKYSRTRIFRNLYVVVAVSLLKISFTVYDI